MLQSRWFSALGTSRKDFLVVFILLFNTFTWYYMSLMIMSTMLNNFNLPTVLEATYYLAVVLSSLVGAFFAKKVKRLKILHLWILLGSVASILPALNQDINTAYALITLVFLGTSLGVGIPSCLAYYADSTTTAKRGQCSGLVFLTVNLGAILAAIVTMSFGLITGAVITAAWRAFGLAIILLSKPSETIVETKNKVSFTYALKDRSFVLYLIPWLMFSLIDRSESPILTGFFGEDFLNSMSLTKPVIGALSALLGGVLADRIGRKRIVVYGYVALGLAYASIGIAPSLTISWYFYNIVDSIAAGILGVTCVLILWGDLAPQNAREKYYAIGNLPLFLAGIVPPLLASYLTLVPASAAFSLASFFLFVAVLPLMYAQETLSERKMEIRKMKGYIEQARKIREKYAPS